jgi:TRAP-type C4-dicarboxylate transport system permease small subunit
MTAHGFEIEEVRETGKMGQSLIGWADRTMTLLNGIIVAVASIALLLAGLVLSYSVAARYFFNAATYWQDEAAVFLLVGSTFMSAAYVQSKRGHIGIEAIVGLLPKRVNQIRSIAVDTVGFLFCTFFAWKSWTLFHEAWVDGQVSSSTWAPPQWIPYSFMALGMSLMSVQMFLQIAIAFDGRRSQ